MSDSNSVHSGSDGLEPLPIESAHDTVGCIEVFAWLVGVGGMAAMLLHVFLDMSASYFNFGLICYILYLVEWCQSKACRYLSNVHSEKDFVDYIETLQKAHPIVTFSIQNYHYENVSTYDASKKKWTTKSKRQNTHAASARFPIASVTDETLSPAQTVAMFHLLHRSAASEGSSLLHETVIRVEGTGEQRLLLACHFPLTFMPRDAETTAALARFKEDFYRSNTTDQFQDKSEKQSLDCIHIDRAMVVLSSAGQAVTERPWWMRRSWLALSTLLLMGLPFRYFLYRRAQKVVWHVRKHFSISPTAAAATTTPLHSLTRSRDPAVARVPWGRNEP